MIGLGYDGKNAKYQSVLLGNNVGVSRPGRADYFFFPMG